MQANEIEFRRRWYAAHVARFAADPEAVREAKVSQSGFTGSADEALRHLDRLTSSGDVEGFRVALQAWAVKPDTLAFNGFSGQMLVNQLVKHSEDHYELGSILIDCLAAPRDIDDASAKLRRIVEHIESIRVGAHPAPRSAAFLLSYFWALRDRRWPILWASAGAYLEFATGIPLPVPPDERYRAYAELVGELDDDLDRFERVVSWWDRTKPLVLDPVLVDRCAFGEDPTGMSYDDLARNAAALVRFGRHVRDLVTEVETATGRPLQARAPGLDWKVGRPRSDAWTDWTDGRSGPGIRVWVNHKGMAIGLKPGLIRSGWYDEAAEEIDRFPLPGFQKMAARGARHGVDVGFIGGASGEFVYGRWFDRERLAEIDLRTEVVDTAVQLRPALDALIALATGEESPVPDQHDPLIPLAAQFRAEGYPTPASEADRADRVHLATLIADGAIGDADPAELGKIWNSRRYGGPGPMAGLNRSVQDPATYDRLLDSIQYLCWGDGEDPDRIDAVLTDSRWKISGLGESVIMKLLAISHPERYLPVFPYSGDQGKQRLLRLLELPEPSGASRGQTQAEANDRLRKRVEPLFPGDPWGMTRFLLWYAAREEQPLTDTDVDPLGELAEELLLDRAFLDDLVELLADRGQIILYGPPGTGKTYIAKKLAEALAPDPARRTIVQFHPSTSYEDFVEGYRPEEVKGQVSYRLTDGPLRAMAEKAKDTPGTRHIMLIDEINRGNLPKVLGELLFLLEYRDEKISTLYRPDESFELPANLWFIGTMNTADRSVALIDAALRRRFHFVPVYPNSGPMEGLLERWLARHHEPEWVAQLVDMVNAELTEALGGPHLQLGPSYFMKRNLDETRVGRIWRYNVEPLMEDQFFGDATQIERFRFDAVHRRFRSQAGLDDVPAGSTGEGDSDTTGPTPE